MCELVSSELEMQNQLKGSKKQTINKPINRLFRNLQNYDFFL